MEDRNPRARGSRGAPSRRNRRECTSRALPCHCGAPRKSHLKNGCGGNERISTKEITEARQTPENAEIPFSKHSKTFTVRLKFPPQVNCYLRVRKLRRFKTKRLKRFSIYRTQKRTNPRRKKKPGGQEATARGESGHLCAPK